MTDYDARLDQEMLTTLMTQRIAALGTLQPDGNPYVSMVPFAIETTTGRVVLQVASMAPHTQHMLDDPRVSLLVISTEANDLPAAAQPRLTLQGRAEMLPSGSADWQTCRAVFNDRFPDNVSINAMLDFDFVALRLSAVRQVSAFGAARNVEADSLRPMLTAA